MCLGSHKTNMENLLNPVNSDESSSSPRNDNGDVDEFDVRLCHWTKSDVGFLVDSLSAQEEKGVNLYTDPNHAGWTEIAQELGIVDDETRLKLTESLASQWKRVREVTPKLLLGYDNDIKRLHLTRFKVGRLLCITSEEEAYEDTSELHLFAQDDGINIKKVYINETENLLPCLDDCVKYINSGNNNTVTMVWTRKIHAWRNIAVAIASLIAGPDALSLSKAIETVKKAVGKSQNLPEELHDQLLEYEHRIHVIGDAKHRHIPQLLPSSPKRTLPSPGPLSSKRHKDGMLEISIPALDLLTSASLHHSTLTPILKPFTLTTAGVQQDTRTAHIRSPKAANDA